jgi:8-oxo-dGTP pyrophosphatase MutT (NUDIX family)
MRIASRQTVFATPFFSLVARTLAGEPLTPYYAIDAPDYVTVLALTRAREVVLVRQFRPAVEDQALELPAGTVEAGERPAHAAARELVEETGFRGRPPELLAVLDPDTGRLSNRMWCYLVREAVRPADWRPTEPGIEVVLCRPRQRARMLSPPSFTHALHLAVLQLAHQRGALRMSVGRKAQELRA